MSGHVEYNFNNHVEGSAGCTKSIRKNSTAQETIFFLIAIPWTAGIQFWWTSKFFSRNPGNFCQMYKKNFTPSDQIVFAHSPKVMTKRYKFFEKVVLHRSPRDKSKASVKTLPKNYIQKSQYIYLMIWDLGLEKDSRKKFISPQTYLLDT